MDDEKSISPTENKVDENNLLDQMLGLFAGGKLSLEIRKLFLIPYKRPTI